jgi:uncharacterized protein (DUF1501 family)
VLVVVNLRGGLDGLSALVPADDANYYDNRSTIAVPPQACTPIDSTFGLHPALSPLASLYQAGHLAFVPAAGSPDPSRSHFDQQDLVDRGAAFDPTLTTGWLARHLAALPRDSGALRAITVVPALPLLMAGDSSAIAVASVEDLALRQPMGKSLTPEALLALNAGSLLDSSARVALAQMATADERKPTSYRPQNGVAYESHSWSAQLRQIAELVRADVGLEAAVVETGGWDLHQAMGGTAAGAMRDQLTHLASALSAFAADTADIADQVTVVVLSEFGRRLAQNGCGGTDHGHGGLMMVLGGGIKGGRIYGAWPGLSGRVLDSGDVPVTTDFRDVLAEIVARRRGDHRLDVVFPGFTPRFLDLAVPR